MPTTDFLEPSDGVRILMIDPRDEDRDALRKIFARSRWNVCPVRSIAEAADFLRSTTVPVVICERYLPDGTWKDVLEEIALTVPAPQLIVTARHADESLWGEVLALGAYDVLAKPFCAPEVFRTISLACRHWNDSGQRVGAPPTALAAAL